MLGIIAGDGDLPWEVARDRIKRGGKCCVAFIGNEFSDLPLSSEKLILQKFALGQVGAMLEFFKSNSVQEIILIGGIARPDFNALDVDFIGARLVARIIKDKFLGDDNILRVVALFLEEQGFIVRAPNIITASAINLVDYNNARLSRRIVEDIDLGVTVLKTLGHLDVGQSVIVKDGYVLGIEAAEGTDGLIERCANLRKKPHGGILVKMVKTGQDIRLDIPAIGSQTIELLAYYGFSGVAIDKNVMVVSADATHQLAREKKIFLVSV